MRYKVQCIYLGQVFFIECVARDYAEAKQFALIQNPKATVLSANPIMWIIMNNSYVKLNLNELKVLMSSLQLLNRKDEMLVENVEQISLPALYNKLVSTVEELNRSEW